jgi:hypothetical protein
MNATRTCVFHDVHDPPADLRPKVFDEQLTTVAHPCILEKRAIVQGLSFTLQREFLARCVELRRIPQPHPSSMPRKTRPTFGNLDAMAALTSETFASSLTPTVTGRPRASDSGLPAGETLTEIIVDEATPSAVRFRGTGEDSGDGTPTIGTASLIR